MTALQRAVLEALAAIGEPASIGRLAMKSQRRPTDVGRALQALERQGRVRRDRTTTGLVWQPRGAA